MATEEFRPGVAIPPGHHLAEELEARGMTQSDLARRMRRPQQAVNEIIRGAKAITAETALQLEGVLGISAETWIRLEGNYRLAKVRLQRSEHEKARPKAAAAVRRRATGTLEQVRARTAGSTVRKRVAR